MTLQRVAWIVRLPMTHGSPARECLTARTVYRGSECTHLLSWNLDNCSPRCLSAVTSGGRLRFSVRANRRSRPWCVVCLCVGSSVLYISTNRTSATRNATRKSTRINPRITENARRGPPGSWTNLNHCSHATTCTPYCTPPQSPVRTRTSQPTARHESSTKSGRPDATRTSLAGSLPTARRRSFGVAAPRAWVLGNWCFVRFILVAWCGARVS